jgi:hypothetical protein
MLNSQAPCIGDLPSTQNMSASMSASSHPIDKQFEQFHAVIQQQQGIIEKLQRQLNFVFSFLGIIDSLSTEDKPAQQISAWSRTGGPTGPQLVPVNNQSSRQHSLNFQESIVATVYVDQAERERRASSLIISGLESSSQSDDKTLVVDLCQSELDISPDIITIKRLGKPVPGRAQPLLVTLRQIEQAKRIINHAKSLRRSSNPTIRQHAFINRNLIKAEAEAAYQVRQQLRRAAALRTTNTLQPAVQPEVASGLSPSHTVSNPTAC